MARQSNDKGKGKKQEEREAKSIGKRAAVKRRSTPKPQYSESSILAALKRKKGVGQAGLTGAIVVAKGSLGIRLLGGLDYLTKLGYRVSFVSPARFAAYVKAKQVTPFTSLKVDGDE